ncbi:MAG: hypothetical protein IJM77_03960 [Spirochaetia bacterium]|nr:hypothetical protein [Spirochaetia bacterium]
MTDVFKAIDVEELERASRIDVQAESRNLMAQLEKASTDAARIRQEAASEAEKIKAQAYEIAHKEGFEKGQKEGFEKGLEQVNKLISQLEIITRDADECRRNILENAKHDIVDLSVKIAEKVVKATCAKQRDIAVRNAEYALGLLKEKSPAVIRVNLADIEIAREYRSVLLNMFDKVESIKIAEDPAVEQGGCIVESNAGGVDANIQTQLSSIRSSLHEE